MDRVEILRNLRLGVIDVVIGINLLREGLDLPEVSFRGNFWMQDKEGFLRTLPSLVQTIGRAARNENVGDMPYPDRMTASMQKTIDETKGRRKPNCLNKANNITPTTVHKSKEMILQQTSVADAKEDRRNQIVQQI
ncbi:MAG: helicase-related protein [Bacteroidia bacterium]